MFIVIVLFSALIFSVVALVLHFFIKPLAIFFLLGNSVALYFIESYHVVLDRTMMGNVFQTNFQEATDFFHPKLLLYVLLYGIIPCIILLKVAIRKDSWLKRLGYLLLVLALGTGWVFANSKTWLWFDSYASRLGGMIMPWSYVANSVRWYHKKYFLTSRNVTLLPDAYAVDNEKKIVVLVIGESARAQNFSAYGYSRPTNPYLSELLHSTHSDNLLALKAISCATYTTASIACMLSHLGAQNNFVTLDEPLPSYLQRQGIDVIWRSNNWGEPAIKVRLYQDADAIRKNCSSENCKYDEILLHGLKEIIENSSQTNNKIFIVLHQTGSHGPSYFQKYPPKFEVFKPVCRSVELQNCNQAELINAYDNTIVYTDHFLHEVIALLKTYPQHAAAMMYISDHGESLGEYGLYLHGTPFSIAPDSQKYIPFIVWTSSNFSNSIGVRGAQVNKIDTQLFYSQDYIFHSVMGALGIRSSFYKKSLDIFHRD